MSLFALVVPPAIAADITVTLHPLSPLTQAQGLPFEFRVSIKNNGSSSQWVTVVQQLAPVSGTASPVEFVSDLVRVPGHATMHREHDVVTAQYFPQLGAFEITPLIQGTQAGYAGQFSVTSPSVRPPTFEDATEEARVGATLPDVACDGQQAAGAAWGDVDNDGDLDLYLPLANQDSKLFVNDGTGHFGDRASIAAVTNDGSTGRAAVFADYDNDGDQDLFVANEGMDRLYRNDYPEPFTEVTPTAGVGDSHLSTSASWGDYDEDGFLDLFVTNYADCQGIGQADRLYHNEGDGTFTDRTELLEGGPGCADGCTTGYGFQGAWFDYDGDGDLDLYLANDFNLTLPDPDVNHLWRNDGPNGQGDHTFTDVTQQAGAAPPFLQSMGIAIGDINGDEDLDVVVSDIRGNDALRNNGSGKFTEVSDDINVDRPWEHAGVATITWGLGFYDLNLDGWEDLYVASGLITGEGSQDPRHNQLFANLGGGTGYFADLSTLSGADAAVKGRGIAFADYDRDGRVDMYVVNQAGSPVLYRNTTDVSDNHWIEIDPQGTTSNRDGCGAVLTARIAARTSIRQVFCGSVSFASGNDPYVHFGLGTATKIDKLIITWPSGTRQTLFDVAADQAIQIVEAG